VIGWRIKELEPFHNYEGLVVPLDRINVDTDQIIPKEFLKLIHRTGFGKYLFNDWRFTADGKPRSEFVLNNPRFKNGNILLTRANFGCGSSREHAVWALSDYGFRVLIAPSYADIFHNNCFKNGVLPITIPEQEVENLFQAVSRKDGYSLRIDLENETITKPDGHSLHFAIDAFAKKCLLEGLDDISQTLEHEAEIRAYELKLRPSQRIEVSRL